MQKPIDPPYKDLKNMAQPKPLEDGSPEMEILSNPGTSTKSTSDMELEPEPTSSKGDTPIEISGIIADANATSEDLLGLLIHTLKNDDPAVQDSLANLLNSLGISNIEKVIKEKGTTISTQTVGVVQGSSKEVQVPDVAGSSTEQSDVKTVLVESAQRHNSPVESKFEKYN